MLSVRNYALTQSPERFIKVLFSNLAHMNMSKKQTLIVGASYNHDSAVTGIAIYEADMIGGHKNAVLIDQMSEASCALPEEKGQILALFRVL